MSGVGGVVGGGEEGGRRPARAAPPAAARKGRAHTPNDKETSPDHPPSRLSRHLAAAEGAHSVVAWLLDAGAAVNPVDRFERTPLADAVLGGHTEVATLLAAAGGRVLESGALLSLPHSALASAAYARPWGAGGALLPEWEIDARALRVGAVVGAGEFGTVHAATWHGTPVAVKIVKRSDAVAVGDFRSELSVLARVHHPCTSQFLGAVTQAAPYKLITELAVGGSVADWLRDARKGKGAGPSAARAAEIALDAARGLLYLHARHPHPIVHRDLKPGNLLLAHGAHLPRGADAVAAARAVGVCKLADFGLSKSLAMRPPGAGEGGGGGGGGGGPRGASPPPASESGAYRLTGETGSYRYMAPEVFRHEPYNATVGGGVRRGGGRGGQNSTQKLSRLQPFFSTPLPLRSTSTPLASSCTSCWSGAMPPTARARTRWTPRGVRRCSTRGRRGAQAAPRAGGAGRGGRRRRPRCGRWWRIAGRPRQINGRGLSTCARGSRRASAPTRRRARWRGAAGVL